MNKKSLKEEKIKELKNKYLKLKKEKSNIYNYKYNYFNIEKINNKQYILTEINEIEEKYSSTRKGFEKLKQNIKEEEYITYSSQYSLRFIVNRNNKLNKKELFPLNEKNTIAIIESEEINENKYSGQLEQLYNELYNEIKNYIGVSDEKTFQLYIEKEIKGAFSFNLVENKKIEISNLLKMFEEYKEDEEFRILINKISK